MENKNLLAHEEERIKIMKNILTTIKGDFVLKGGTGLLFGYGLNRFSEDIDLDIINSKARKSNLKKLMETLEHIDNYQTRVSIKKDTDTTFRAMVDYGGKRSDLPVGMNDYNLKVEVSLRNKGLNMEPNNFHDVNGITVYTIENLITQKIKAFSARSKARDIYDIGFLLNNYEKNFSLENYLDLAETIDRRDVDSMEYELKTALFKRELSGITKSFDPTMYSLAIAEQTERGLEQRLALKEEKLAKPKIKINNSIGKNKAQDKGYER